MRPRPVIPREAATRDMVAAIDHYRDEGAVGAAAGMIDAVEEAFRLIGRHPDAGSPRYAHDLDLPGLRAWPLKGFPYLVFYQAREDHVDVWRVLHQERDIPAWLRGTE